MAYCSRNLFTSKTEFILPMTFPLYLDPNSTISVYYQGDFFPSFTATSKGGYLKVQYQHLLHSFLYQKDTNR